MLCAALPVQAQAPTGLTVKAATSKRVDLAWSGTAASYSVERRVLGGIYAGIGTASATTFSDTQVDPYTTYQYHVIANAVAGASSPSNEVTVGPPPSGFSTAATAPGPADSYIAQNFAYDISLALDTNGDPALAWVFDDPNGDSDGSDTKVVFPFLEPGALQVERHDHGDRGRGHRHRLPPQYLDWLRPIDGRVCDRHGVWRRQHARVRLERHRRHLEPKGRFHE